MLNSRLFQGDALLQQIADDVGGARISTTQHRNDPAVKKVQQALLLWDPACLPRFGPDGDYGSESADAVLRFKREVLMAPPPLFNDVGPQTVQRLDAIALAHEATPFSIRSVRLIAEDFVTPLDWDTSVVGMNILNKLVINIEGFGFLNECPSSVEVEVSSASPNATGHTPSVPPKRFAAPAISFPPDPLTAGPAVYQLELPLTALEPFAAVGAPTLATIVRQDEPAFPGDPHSKGAATSDSFFRSGLGSAVGRGFGRQTRGQRVGTNPLPRDGDLGALRPDSLSLLIAAGVEILAVSCGGQTARALLRRPAGIVYYSGHGLGASNCLGVAQLPADSSYTCWAKAADLVPTWTPDIATRVFVIAGCSLLQIDFSTSPPSGTGLEWVKLLRGRGGPLDALLGYRAAAPSDSGGGNDIATEFARKLALGLDPALSWMDVNEAHHAWNAVAITAGGQYTLFEDSLLHPRQTRVIP